MMLPFPVDSIYYITIIRKISVQNWVLCSCHTIFLQKKLIDFFLKLPGNRGKTANFKFISKYFYKKGNYASGCAFTIFNLNHSNGLSLFNQFYYVSIIMRKKRDLVFLVKNTFLVKLNIYFSLINNSRAFFIPCNGVTR